MIFGLAGAHRSGKTTLAKRVSESGDVLYVDAAVSRLMREAGYDAVANLSYEDRLDAQEKLLDSYLRRVTTYSEAIITDRTPLDMAGYMLCEVGMHSNAQLGDRVKAYVDRCIEATEMYFDLVAILPPLPFYDAEEGKPPVNAAYQYHHHTVVSGLAQQIVTPAIICHDPDLNIRTQYITDMIGTRVLQVRNEVSASAVH